MSILQMRITAMCGCYTDRHARTQHKCAIHARNPIAAGYTLPAADAYIRRTR